MQLVHLFAINLRGMESLQEPLAMEWTSSELMEIIFLIFFLNFYCAFSNPLQNQKFRFFNLCPLI